MLSGESGTDVRQLIKHLLERLQITWKQAGVTYSKGRRAKTPR